MGVSRVVVVDRNRPYPETRRELRSTVLFSRVDFPRVGGCRPDPSTDGDEWGLRRPSGVDLEESSSRGWDVRTQVGVWGRQRDGSFRGCLPRTSKGEVKGTEINRELWTGQVGQGVTLWSPSLLSSIPFLWTPVSGRDLVFCPPGPSPERRR